MEVKNVIFIGKDVTREDVAFLDNFGTELVRLNTFPLEGSTLADVVVIADQLTPVLAVVILTQLRDLEGLPLTELRQTLLDTFDPEISVSYLDKVMILATEEKK